MDDLGLLLPNWNGVNELLEVIIEASLDGVLIGFHGLRNSFQGQDNSDS